MPGVDPSSNANCFVQRKGMGTFALFIWSIFWLFWDVGSSPRELENCSIRTSKTFAYSPIFTLKCLKISPGLCKSTELIKSYFFWQSDFAHVETVCKLWLFLKAKRRFYVNFDFFFDFFCDLLVIQQRVFHPPYVGIFNSFSPVIEI